MGKITFVTLFRRINEGEYYTQSIVAYGKKPWVLSGLAIIEYKHFLYINLWLVELRFDWISKVNQGAKE